MLIHLKWQLLFDTCPPPAVKQQIWKEPEWSDRSVCHLSPQFTGDFSCRCLSDVFLHKIFAATLPLVVIVMCLSWHQIWLFGKMVLQRASRCYFASNTSCRCHHFTVAEHNLHRFVLRFKVFLQFFLMTTWWKNKNNHNPGWIEGWRDFNYSKYMQRSGCSISTSLHFLWASMGNKKKMSSNHRCAQT